MTPEGDITDAQKERRVVLLDKPEAVFRVVYGTHSLEQASEELGEADGYVIESGATDYATPESAELLLSYVKRNVQYRRIVERAEMEKKPIFFVDITSGQTIAILQVGLKVLEPAIGMRVLSALRENNANKEQKNRPTRREFLDRLGKGAGAVYLLSGLPDIAAGMVFPRSQVDRFLATINEKIHPETDAILLTLRNYLIAQKTEAVANMLAMEQQKKPEVAVVIGQAHSGIERALQKSEQDRVAVIDKLLAVPGLGDARKKIAAIARLDFMDDGGGWKASISQDPHLAQLAEQ